MSKLNLSYLKPLISLYLLGLIGYVYFHPWATHTLSLLILIFGISLALTVRRPQGESLIIAFSTAIIILLFYFRFFPSPFLVLTDAKIPFGLSFLLTVFFIAGVMFSPMLLLRLLRSRK